MSRNGSGVYSPSATGYPAVDGTTIEAGDFNAVVEDIAAALTTSISTDGQSVVTANIPMASHKLTGLAAGTANGDSVRYNEFVSELALKADADGSYNETYLINGDFAIWQSGVDTALSTDYTADCWGKHNFQSGMVTRQPLGAISKYLARVSGDGTANTSRLHIGQGIPLRDTIPLRGSTVTLSGYVKFSAATLAMGNWSANVGYSDSSNDGNFATTNYALTGSGSTTYTDGALPTTWTKFTLTVDIGASAQNIVVYFQFANLADKATTDYYDLARIKLELGSVATPFVPVAVSDELLRCLPYCEKSFDLETNPAQGVGTSGAIAWKSTNAGASAYVGGATFRFRVSKRVAPTITLFNPSAANAQARDVTAGADCSSTSSSNISENQFTVNCTGNASTIVGSFIAVHYIAKAFL